MSNTTQTPKITTRLKTNFAYQKGVDIQLENDTHTAKLNIWCDNMETDDVRIFITLDNDEELLLACVDSDEFIMPTLSTFTETGITTITFTTCTVTLNVENDMLDIVIAEFVGTEKEDYITKNSFPWNDILCASKVDHA
jgi:hypothetical protein